MKIMVFDYLVMNILGLFIMKIDKHRAINHQFRIPEKNLWLTAIMGGAAGATLGMKLFRHKTKHLSFKVGFPLLAIVELILFIYLIDS